MMSAVIFFIFGIPQLILFTAFVFIAAMVPILSGMMVFLPAHRVPVRRPIAR